MAFTPITACAAGRTDHVVSHDAPRGPRDGLARVLDVLAVSPVCCSYRRAGTRTAKYEEPATPLTRPWRLTDALADLALDATPPLIGPAGGWLR
ncbi:MAG: hypothetical protein H6726_26335 [Sandaracinaceae bacterium]|nr:hypothetical protein [Sandaracinaceae bacterium]